MWIIDPSTNTKSVSLTLLLISVGTLIVVGLLQVAGRVSTVGPFENLCYSFVALYFGRRLNVSSKAFTADKYPEDSNAGKN